MERSVFPDKFNPLFLEAFKKRVEKAKEYVGEEVLRTAFNQIYEIFSSGGKRARPYVLFLTYKSVGGENDFTALRAGVALEFFQSFVLVQDDIIDRGEKRHDTTTLHKKISHELKKHIPTHDADHIGNSEAMLIGDLLLAYCYDELGSIDGVSGDVLRMAQAQLTIMANEVIIGQMLDAYIPTQNTISDETIENRDLLKTASYTFINPMLIGLILAGQRNKYEKFCRDFGSALGLAYQMHDELTDIEGGEGKDRYADVREHQHTRLTQYVFENGSKEEKEILRNYFKRVGNEEESNMKVISILSSKPVVDFARERMKAQYSKAREVLGGVDFTSEYKENWRDFITYLEDR